MGLDKTAQGYQEEGVIKLLKDIRDGLRPPGPDNNGDNNDDNNDDIDDNDDNNEERVVIDNKKITKDILDEAGKKINKFYQEKSMYHNELKHELEKKLKIIEQRDDIFRDIVRHTRNDKSEKQINIDFLNRDIERLNNLNEEHLKKEYKYKKEINELKNNLSNEKKVRKKLEKIYEDLKNDNDNLLFEFDGIKMINKMLKEDNHIYKQKIEEIEKELEKSEEYINIDAKIKDNAKKDINEFKYIKRYA